MTAAGNKLKLGDFSIPATAVTETFGLLAVRGAGKTNAARVMAEEMFSAGLPFVAVDPVGSWWGLRAGSAGGRGLPIPIFGGKHGDVPLERTGGHLVADLVTGQRLTCVLDLSGFESEGAKKGFLLDFARRLYQKSEEPLHLFLEEADDYIPQRPMRDEAELLRAWENIVRRGRARGLGITMITQRSAAINKNVLTQVGTLIAMRTTGPQDRDAIESWLRYHGQAREILESLPKLEAGQAWIWSPEFLRQTAKVRFRMSSTLDSGATPKVSKKGRAAATLADVDLEEVRTKMVAAIERAKADDPRELRARIRVLEGEIERAKHTRVEPERVEVPMLSETDRKNIQEMASILKEAHGEVAGALTDMSRAGQRIDAILRELSARTPTNSATLAPRYAAVSQPRSTSKTRQIAPQVGTLPKGMAAILTAAIQTQGGVTREQLTVMTGYKRSSRDTYIQRLREQGFLLDRNGILTATDAGAAALGDEVRPLPTGSALLDHWRSKLPSGELACLEVAVKHYPHEIGRETISEQTGYKRSSRDTYLQRLRSRRLIVVRGGRIAAAEELFG